jgi:protein-tyrosine-phosphatase
MKILYICTHNRCRSIFSEAITNHGAGNTIDTKSAGSQPAGMVHPLSLKYLQQAGIVTDGFKVSLRMTLPTFTLILLLRCVIQQPQEHVHYISAIA